ncbi:MAG: enoyl-CoA hydratase/isomerase family protein [Alphaproteobacteria bacterium]|nr:enoyl-CoA hydratase/isomerase family protein [Alphaproteobacteria bacterium]
MSDYQNTAASVVLDDGIATLTLAQPGGFNKINPELIEGLTGALDYLDTVQGLKGIILTSGHRDFCVGADLDMVYGERDPANILGATQAMNAALRRLEQKAPVVAAINGSALGGGYEVALAGHRRIAIDDPRLMVGLPEVNLGVFPGGGGTQRLPRLIGIQAALEVILQGQMVRAPKAVKMGLVDELASDRDDLMAKAKAWLLANPKSKQPWDDPKFRWPGVRPGSADARNLLLAASAMLYKKTAGAFPAAEDALSVVQEGAAVTFDRALEIEGRAFAKLATSDQAKDMIRTLFFHKTAAEKQKGLPRVEDDGFRKVAVLGAGMMGAGLAFVCAKAGYDVVLKDISEGALEKGMAHIDGELKKLRHLDDAAKAALRAKITPTVDLETLRGTDLVIEAVFEDLDLKHRVIRETEPYLSANGIFASNTSALPITDLAKASAHPDRFIGLHYFSPVEKMPLLEIICGEATGDDTLARSLAFARKIKKTVIVVNDGYGFFTSRVFSSYILEGAQLVAEGYDPNTIEWAARAAGMVVSPLQVFDEVSLALGVHAMTEAKKYRPDAEHIEGVDLVFGLVEAGRKGKAYGAGFYDYEGGKRRGIWPGLAAMVGGPGKQGSLKELGQRLMLAQVAEVGRALDEGIIRNWRDAEVGAIFGIGFAPNTGGPLAYIDRFGLPALVAELDRLAVEHGKRYAPSQLLRDMAAKGERFFDA